ncbi:MAG: hypothetical protein J0H64_02375, partial [Actinobacteria bacterium]|nr:hypothetical protein [Actinomycetota bacterium]
MSANESSAGAGAAAPEVRAETSAGVQDRPDRLRAVPWGAVILYVVIAMGLAWVVALPIWLSGGASSPHLAILVPLHGAVM